MNPVALADLAASPELPGSFPRQFAEFIRQRQQDAGRPHAETNLLANVAALLAHTMERGHVCLDLSRPPELRIGDHLHPVTLPPLKELLRSLADASGPAISPANQNRPTPLLLAQKPVPAVYLQRYFHYERSLEAAFSARTAPVKGPPPNAPERLFPNPVPRDDRPAAAAVAHSLRFPLSIVAGGPGTGKTTIALRILAAHFLHRPDSRVAMAAPTGKAAVRIEESITANLPGLRQSLSSALPENLFSAIEKLRGATLHRLLGPVPASPYFRHNPSNPLPLDLLILDEGSMIDLPLMAKLMEALPASAHLVLLGDPHQLPSVEVGSVFADSLRDEAIQSVTTTLHRNFRAREAPAIIRLCDQIRNESVSPSQWLQSLDESGPEVVFHPLHSPADLTELHQLAIRRYTEALSPDLPPAEAFNRSLSFRVLTAVRQGPYGMQDFNTRLLRDLPDHHQLILVGRNEPAVGLYNGDIGLLPADSSNEGTAWFPARHSLPRLRVPPFSPAYAMTGHRAQGSEFAEVHVILPAARQSPVLTREWLYTAISRARHRLHLWASPEAVHQCLRNPTRRLSGLFLRPE